VLGTLKQACEFFFGLIEWEFITGIGNILEPQGEKTKMACIIYRHHILCCCQ